MALTRNFKDTIVEEVESNPDFRKALFEEAVNAMLCGDIDVGKAVLKNYINATVGFEELATVTEKSSKSLHRMFGPSGNPTAKNLFKILEHLQQKEGSQLQVRFVHK